MITRKILNNSEIRDDMFYSFCKHIKQNFDEVIEDVINGESILELDGVSFENTIYKSEDGLYYLLESRYFSLESDEMLDAYLMILDSNFEKVETYVDDVWSFTEWERIA